MICCGRFRRTPHCPQCGKALRSSEPGPDLVAHCDEQVFIHAQKARTHRLRVKNHKRLAEQPGPEGDAARAALQRYELLAEREEAISTRWQRRSEYLAGLLEVEHELHAARAELAGLRGTLTLLGGGEHAETRKHGNADTKPRKAAG